MIKPKLLATRPLFPEVREVLDGHFAVEYWTAPERIPRAEFLKRAADKDALICLLTEKVDEELLAAAPRLRIAATVSVGFDNIDVAACTRRVVVATNTPGVLDDSTADLAWALILAVARRARGFRMRILYNNRNRVPQEIERELEAEFVDRDTLFRSSDFLSVHVPLNSETRHLISKENLQNMKRTAYLINTSRGPVVDEAALAEALRTGVIAGAGLDVFEHEPKVCPALIPLKNVVLAPHIGSATIETRTRMAMIAAKNVVALFEGQRPPNALNAETLGL